MKIIITTMVILVLMLLAATFSVQLEPIEQENGIKLRWFGLKNNYILQIDNIKEFSSPFITEVKGRYYNLELSPGIWYWRIDNNLPKKLTVDSRVEVKRNKEEITNTGNTEIKLTGITGFTILNPKETKKIGEVNVTAEEI